MKKNVKCNLLKSLFLTGTVLTVSACNKGDEKISSMNNELKGLKQEMEEKISQVEKTIEQSKKHKDKLIENINESIGKLETIKDADFFLDELNNIKNSLNQIDNENDKKEIIKKIKDNDKIKFHFEKDFNGNVNFSCGEVVLNDLRFYSKSYDDINIYLNITRAIIDIVGLDDNYKIDLSQLKVIDFYPFYERICHFPKEYFVNKVFHFDIDKNKNILAGWEKAKMVDTKEYGNIVKELFCLYILNPNLVDDNFNPKNIKLEDLKLSGTTFKFKFFFKNDYVCESSVDAKLFPFLCTNFFSPSNSDNFLAIDLDSAKKCQWSFKDSNKNVILTLNNFQDCENFSDFINAFGIKNFLTVCFDNDKISLKDEITGFLVDFYFSNMKDGKDYMKHIKILKCLKQLKLINYPQVNLTFGSTLNIENFNLLELVFDSRYNEYSIKDIEKICNNITALFELFDIEDCFVNLVEDGKGNKQMKLSQGGKDYFYELDSSTNKLKFVIK